MKTVKFPKGTVLYEEGVPFPAAFYMVREGSVELKNKGEVVSTVTDGGQFGSDQLTIDARNGRNGPNDSTAVVPKETAICVQDSVIAVLSVLSLRSVIDTVYIGEGKGPSEGTRSDSIKVKLNDVTRHTILGAGTFGQVWLVSRKTSDGSSKAYALKIQSKYELCQSGQAQAVVYEKNVMAALSHPFIAGLVAAFQDEKCVYMLMNLIQGGEMHSVMHTSTRNHLPEGEAIFYAAGIAEGLAYMHRRGMLTPATCSATPTHSLA
jgi:Protein kinase domain